MAADTSRPPIVKRLTCVASFRRRSHQVNAEKLKRDGWILLILLSCYLLFPASLTADSHCHLRLTITTPLPFPNTPLDPEIDFGEVILRNQMSGVLDPNTIELWNTATGQRVPHALGEGLAFADHGRIQFVVNDPAHTEYEVRFQTSDRPRSIQPRSFTPNIGVGDLLRYNAGCGRPITLFYSMGLHDLNRDGVADLTGTWNYAYRPNEPWNGAVVYPGTTSSATSPHEGPGAVTKGIHFGERRQLRYVTSTEDATYHYFDHTYMAVDFADFNRDGLLDLVQTRNGVDSAQFYLHTGKHELRGLPIFQPSHSARVKGWQACRAIDLDGDGALDLVVDGNYVRNMNPQGWPFQAASPRELDAGRQPCFLDIDGDGRLDAVCLQGASTVQPDFYRIAWRKNLGGTPPAFGDERLLADIDARLCTFVSAYHDQNQTGLIVQHNAFQEISFYRLLDGESELPRFVRQGRAESLSAVLSLSDQAWPCVCDWDDDGDPDLLVGGGYGWPRIVINQGTLQRPAFAEPQPILADGQPIRLLRNEILGSPQSWHNMGYPYPTFVDWDGDALPDLILPNETNRIFWYKNVGSRSAPVFGPQQQLSCDKYPDSVALRQLSAARANDSKSNNGVYPHEQEQAFMWRTGVAVADFTGDGLPDLVTHDGSSHVATLFTQYLDSADQRRLRKHRVLTLTNGKLINDQIINRSAHWTESFRAIDWDRDGLQDLIYSVAGSHHDTLDDGSIYLLKNAGTPDEPKFESPQALRCFGQPIRITHHGPHPWPADFNGDGYPDLVTCVEWSVYPYYTYAALMMPERPKVQLQVIDISP